MAVLQDRAPVVYLSHGAPPLADDPVWPAELADWAEKLTAVRRPSAILVVSAHWEHAPIAVSATRTVPLLYDFWGFPDRYYQVTYPAPGAPELARSVAALLGPGVGSDQSRGLDHGAYVPLVEMFPAADIPVLQLSMPTLAPEALLAVGRRLAPLRDEGVLILGSGFTTHNLSAFRPALGPDHAPPAWSTEFDHWAAETVAAQDLDALADFLHRAPAATLAHPRTEHFAPLFVALGAAGEDASQSVVDGYWYGMSKRSWQFG